MTERNHPDPTDPAVVEAKVRTMAEAYPSMTERTIVARLANEIGLKSKEFKERYNTYKRLDKAFALGRSRRTKTPGQARGLVGFYLHLVSLNPPSVRLVTQPEDESRPGSGEREQAGDWIEANEFFGSVADFARATEAHLFHLYTVEEAEAYLEASDKSIREWIHSGALWAVKADRLTGGKGWLIPGFDLLRFKASRGLGFPILEEEALKYRPDPDRPLATRRFCPLDLGVVMPGQVARSDVTFEYLGNFGIEIESFESYRLRTG